MKTTTRGSTLIEVMVASVILLTGMTGLTALIIKGMSAHREVNVQLQAQNLASSIASQYATVAYPALAAGTYNTGIRTDEDGRSYPSSTIITQMGDGGVGAWRIESHVQWKNYLRQTIDEVSVTIVSETPDASF